MLAMTKQINSQQAWSRLPLLLELLDSTIEVLSSRPAVNSLAGEEKVEKNSKSQKVFTFRLFDFSFLWSLFDLSGLFDFSGLFEFRGLFVCSGLFDFSFLWSLFDFSGLFDFSLFWSLFDFWGLSDFSFFWSLFHFSGLFDFSRFFVHSPPVPAHSRSRSQSK